VYVLADQPVIDGRHPLDLLRSQWLERGRGDVARHLLGVAGAGDDRGHAGLIDHPAQRELGHRCARRYERAQFLHSAQTCFVVNAREGFSLIEGLAMTGETAMVVGGELRIGAHLAGQQTAGQRHTRQDADAAFASAARVTQEANASPTAAPNTARRTLSVSSGRTRRAAPAPMATTEPANHVGLQKATLNGVINPQGSATTYYFQYGRTKHYTRRTRVRNAGAGLVGRRVAALVKRLKPGKTYHFRVVALSASGKTFGADRKFKTRRPKKR